MTLNAEFASFVDITIYPVPVTNQRFSVDFNLVAPMNINMTVVNNVGVPYHSKLLQYNMAGLNKYVVRMDPAWPAGVYPCLFQYTDGSSESMSILVK